MDGEIGEIERRMRIALWHRGNPDSQWVAEIPGVGVLTATGVFAAMGDPAAFRSGREFAAWLSLVPRHDGTTAPEGRFACSASPSAAYSQNPALFLLLRRRQSANPVDPWRAFRAHQRQGTAGMGGAPGRAAAGQRGHVRAGQQRWRERSAPCWLMTGRIRRTSSASRYRCGRRDSEPTKVVAERLRKARQRVMANRSDRDPPSLNPDSGAKPERQMRRESADSIRASGK